MESRCALRPPACQQKLAEDFANERFNLFALAIFKEALLETLPRNCRLHQFRINCTQRIKIVVFNDRRFDLIKDPGVTHLRFFTLWRVTFAIAPRKGFLEDKAHVQFCPPSQTLSQTAETAHYRC